MKKIFAVAAALAVTALLASAALAEKGGKGKEGVKGEMKDKVKIEKIEGEVVKVEKDAKTCPGCEMLIATVKTEQGEEKVCLCLSEKNKVEVKAGDKLEVKLMDKLCKMDGKKKPMLCAKKAKCNGKSLKLKKCPMMKDKKKDKECPAMKKDKKDKDEKDVKEKKDKAEKKAKEVKEAVPTAVPAQ